MNNMMVFINAHIGSLLAGSSLATGFVLSEIKNKLPEILGKDLASGIAGIEKKLTRPEDLAAFKAILTALAARIPDAGDAFPSLASEEIVKAVPALFPFQGQIRELIAGLDAAVKADLKP